MKNLTASFHRLIAVILLALGMAGPCLGEGVLERLQPSASAGLASRLKADHVEVSLFLDQSQHAPGQSMQLLLTLAHEPGWHTYWRNPGDAGLPTQVQASLTGRPLPIERRQWPVPGRYPVGPLASFGYQGEVTLGATVRLPDDLAPGQYPLTVTVNWLVCRDVCIPGEGRLGQTVNLVTTPNAALSDPEARLALAQLTASLPEADAAGRGYAISREEGLIRLWGRGQAVAARGHLFLETESLAKPAAAQALYSTEEGWLLALPLADTPDPGIRALSELGVLHGVWRPAQDKASTDQAKKDSLFGGVPPAGLRFMFTPGEPPKTLGLISAGVTAEQAAGPSDAKTGAESTSLDWGWPLLAALGGAFLGGLILNLMPCVFPVLGLKVLSLSQQAHTGESSWPTALLFTAGVLVSMLVLAGLMLGLRAAGETLGWGFQLQNSAVVIGLAVLFLAIALNLLGVFEFGSSLTRLGGLDLGEGPWNGFGSGVLAVLVASPCTAPFMGGALGFTLTASTFETLLVFSSLGLGLALPFALLSIRPQLLAWLPRPGVWMDDFRHLLAFPMLATVAWLAWVLAVQRGGDVVLSLLLGLVLMSLGLSLYGRSQHNGLGDGTRRSARRALAHLLRLLVWLSALALLGQAAGLWVEGQSRGRQPVGAAPAAAMAEGVGSAAQKVSALPWQPWAPGLPEQQAALGRVVFVDFTAAWCLSCQVNKLRVLESSPVMEALARPEVVTYVADWTSRDPQITRALERLGRSGVPVYLVYPAGGGQPRLLSEWLSSEEVMAALTEAGLR